MSHLQMYKWPDGFEWLKDIFLFALHQDISSVFELYKAAKTIQKYVRGFITRRRIKKLHRNAIIIQKCWRGFKVRILSMRFARKRYYEKRTEFYNEMAAVIQGAWRGYKSRQDPFKGGCVKLYKQAMLANERMKIDIRKFQNQVIKNNDQRITAEKKKWLNYALPKLHHLIRTKAIPGVFSLKDDSLDYSTVEKLLTCYNFSIFVKELNQERKENAESLYLLGTDYKLKGSALRDEKLWKRKYLLDNPKL